MAFFIFYTDKSSIRCLGRFVFIVTLFSLHYRQFMPYPYHYGSRYQKSDCVGDRRRPRYSEHSQSQRQNQCKNDQQQVSQKGKRRSQSRHADGLHKNCANLLQTIQSYKHKINPQTRHGKIHVKSAIIAFRARSAEQIDEHFRENLKHRRTQQSESSRP